MLGPAFLSMTEKGEMMTSHPDALSLTRKLLAFNTVNPPGQERDCAEYIGNLLQPEGFKIRYQEYDKGRANLIATKEEGGDRLPICFTGHLDTIPLGTTPWRCDPFAGELAEDKLYGRGSSDMKGGVAAMVLAALRLSPLLPGKGGIKLVFTAGEEQGCEGAAQLRAQSRLVGKAGALVVGEPTSNYPVIGHKGAMFLEARTRGITAHGSMPDQGVNAVYKAARAVLALEAFKFGVEPHSVLGSPTLNVGTISGGLNVNSVPDLATIGIDIRTIPALSHDGLYARLRSYLGEEVELVRTVDAGSVWTEPDDEWVQLVFDLMEPYLNERPTSRAVTYFTDASELKPALGHPPTLILGPGEANMAHKTDEFCYLANLDAAVEIYTEIARNWCGL